MPENAKLQSRKEGAKGKDYFQSLPPSHPFLFALSLRILVFAFSDSFPAGILYTTNLPARIPPTNVSVRPATHDDSPFVDALQKKQSKQVGFLHAATLCGKLELGHVLIAEIAGRPAGYSIGNDRYFKRDDVGAIFQINVVPALRRSLVAAELLRAQFARSAYGCRLYCCWCAQDIEANRFWEAMGFVPLAFRTGSRTRGAKGTPRVHIFGRSASSRGTRRRRGGSRARRTAGACGRGGSCCRSRRGRTGAT